MPGSGQVFATILIAGLIHTGSCYVDEQFLGNKARVPYSDFVQLVEGWKSGECGSRQFPDLL